MTMSAHHAVPHRWSNLRQSSRPLYRRRNQNPLAEALVTRLLRQAIMLALAAGL